MSKHRFILLSWACVCVFASVTTFAQPTRNPVIWADVPDVAIIRVGDTYYMSSTTMHMSPGLPIMKSKDLVSWQLVGYAYETLADNDSLTLQNGQDAYGAGSWASSLRYHNGTFYATTFSATTGKTYVYKTEDIENGPWQEHAFEPVLHDHSLFFDDDGRVYMVHGAGDLRLTELTADATAIKPGGVDQVIIPDASLVAGKNVGLPAEGSQVRKIDGKYYVMNITWPRGDMRTQIVHRADRITGPYEGRVVLKDQGVAQGGLIDTPEGDWYALLFQDHGAVGRTPYLVAVKWQDGWPAFGDDGKVPLNLDIPSGNVGAAGIADSGIVASDEFDRQSGEPAMPLAWQWNHNPDNEHWSVADRPGWLRLTTGRVVSDLMEARGTLTQRTFGPESFATTAIDVAHMKDGDIAGLAVLQKKYGFVGVKVEGQNKSIVMVSAESDSPVEIESMPLTQENVFLKVGCDYKNNTDKATFYYSLDGNQWSEIGKPLQMVYTLPHFMGYRFALFNFATKNPGGFVDFDYYRVSGLRSEPVAVAPSQSAELFPLSSVRLLDGPFSSAVDTNVEYLLMLRPDRLLAPFRVEAGLKAKAAPYGNWESSGLDGHTAGHYLSALANMIASGNDTNGELERRLDYMLDELQRCQEASGNGYIGGVPDSRTFWSKIAAGHVDAIRSKWVPWYNVHKTFAGLRDTYQVAGKQKARDLLVGFGDWCVRLTSGLSDAQMQRMIGTEYGGMNEVLADIYAITGDKTYLQVAKRFNHRELFDPLIRHEDRLTGKHANTQIPKIIGMERIAALTDDSRSHSGAKFFWQTVTQNRCVAFGGNSVAEHFNDPNDFSGMLKHREGPETCNTYNMLRLTEQLFAAEPNAAYADAYERNLFNHILSAIHPTIPGYVYFTPIRPQHYRVYSQPDQSFWCCVGTGMENPGKYGQFIYARDNKDIYVNLFIASELTVSDAMRLRQETRFPDEPRTQITLELKQPSTFSLYLRHPTWVATDQFAVKVNGEPVQVHSTPSSYVKVQRQWKNGDVVEVELPMQTTAERLPDGSDWAAIMRGPILLACPTGSNDMTGLRADDARMGHIAHGPLVPLERIPSLLTSAEELPKHIVADPTAGPFSFRLVDVVEPNRGNGLPLIPFFRLHDSRYQIYWQLTTLEQFAAEKERLAAEDQKRAIREAATLDSVAVGEQQPEVEHDFVGSESETGLHQGQRWRHGAWFQYTLDSRGEKNVDVEVTYWGGDAGRKFDIFANETIIGSETLQAARPGEFFQKRYPIPTSALAISSDGRVTIKFAATQWVAGGVYDLRLVKRSGTTTSESTGSKDSIEKKPALWNNALTPPMGWNSWDIFGTTLNEDQARAQADAMAKHLLPHGWKYFTVDIQWYEPEAKGHVYQAGAPLAMDAFSRLLPAVKKFPSAADGAGFKPLADYVHSRQLKFGIHLMRGIPRQAVKQNTPIVDTKARAADIANTDSVCPWNPDMYGVDMSKPGAQAYYDSLFKLYASWGVDFVKVDDISRPYDKSQMAEIEAIRKAIDNCGRPMVLSLSPGDTPIERGEHVMKHANMWRISDDFWDRWPPLYEMFGRLEKWTPFQAKGAWPDADMLPFGIIEMGRPTNFTKDEQRLCMSLWCIARSPLIFGGDMTKLDEFTLNLLTNPEVLAVNQKSTNNRQQSREGDLIVWTADIPDSRDHYVAMFNAQNPGDLFDFSRAAYRSPILRGESGHEVVEIAVPIEDAKRLVLAVGDGGDGNFYDHAAWINPTLTGPKGTLKLSELDWQIARAGWREVRRNRTVDDRPIQLDGKTVEGIGTHSVSLIQYELPKGYDTFTARGVMTQGCEGKGSIEFLVLVDPKERDASSKSLVSVTFAELGDFGRAKVRDLWQQEDLGEFTDKFSQEFPPHAAGLYRVTPIDDPTPR